MRCYADYFFRVLFPEYFLYFTIFTADSITSVALILMIIYGSVDFLMIINIVKFKPDYKKIIYYNYPSEIGSALIGLVNEEIFIDRHINFINLFTGNEASGYHYIEYRTAPVAFETFYKNSF